ncbi:hypothetical protein [Halomarina litorea]|uniref:hypothetical protein n=1 Tax=Halomarina litorea TaxID=2961595 RepID=UPI0020C4B032|nr:hypothetical protein [Halomarina sp. BCD28]
MIDSTDPDREGNGCELLVSGRPHEASPCTNGTLSADDYTRCRNRAVGEFRVCPDQGGEVVVRLCRAHREEYAEHVAGTPTEQ